MGRHVRRVVVVEVYEGPGWAKDNLKEPARLTDQELMWRWDVSDRDAGLVIPAAEGTDVLLDTTPAAFADSLRETLASNLSRLDAIFRSLEQDAAADALPSRPVGDST